MFNLDLLRNLQIIYLIR